MKKIQIKNESLIKKIVGAIFIILCFSILIGLVCANTGPIFSNEQYYSQTELDQKNKENYDKGYTDGINSYEDLNKHLEDVIDDYNRVELILVEKQDIINQNNNTIAENEKTITDLQTALAKEQEDRQKDNNDLQEQIIMLEEQKANLQSQVDTMPELNSQIENLNIEIESLQTQLENNINTSNERILELQNNINSLTAINSELQTENEINLSSITELNNQITALNIRIQEIEKLISAFNNNGFFTVSFLNSNNEVIYTEAYNRVISSIPYSASQNLTLPEDKTFSGWSIDKETVIQLPYTLTENIVLYPMFTNWNSGLFTTDGTLVASFDELIENEYFIIEDQILNFGNNASSSINFRKIINSSIIGDRVLVVPTSVKGLGTNLFSYSRCQNLYELVLPNTIEEIGVCCFNQSSVYKMNIPTNLKKIGNKAFYMYQFGNTAIDLELNNIEYLGESAFESSKLKSIVLGDKLQEISKMAFNSCTSLESIILPSNLKSISGWWVFRNCSSLKTIYLPSSLETINTVDYRPYSAFVGCSSNLTIYLGANEVPTGFGQYWNYSSDNDNAELVVKYGYTYEQYCEEIVSNNV